MSPIVNSPEVLASIRTTVLGLVGIDAPLSRLRVIHSCCRAVSAIWCSHVELDSCIHWIVPSVTTTTVCLEEGSGEQFGKLDQVAEGVAEEGETAADGGQHERLGDHRHAARAQLLDGLVNARHVQAEMVIAA